MNTQTTTTTAAAEPVNLREKMLDKVRKLMRLSKSGNENEAHLALTKAAEIMREYEISHADLEVKALEEEPVVSQFYKVPDCKMKYKWLEQLALACSILYDGTILIGPTLHETSFMWVGTKSRIELMQVTFEHLWSCWQSFVELDLESAKEVRLLATGSKFAPRDTMHFKVSHGAGYARMITIRIAILIRQREEAARKAQGWALVLVDKKKEKLEAFARDNGCKSQSIEVNAPDGSAFAAGFRQGSKVEISKSLT